MSAAVWTIAVLGGLITYSQRAVFLALAHRATEVPPAVREALRMIPAAALAALVAPAVFRAGAGGAVDLTNPRIVAAAVALAVMWRTRNVLLTLATGLAVLMVLQHGLLQRLL